MMKLRAAYVNMTDNENEAGREQMRAASPTVAAASQDNRATNRKITELQSSPSPGLVEER